MRLGPSLALIFSTFLPALAAPGSDVAIAREANAALRAAKGLDGSAILLENQGGTVTLLGSVPSDAARTLAAETVRGVPGVLEVRDRLDVVTPAVERAMRRADAALKRDIERGLKADPSLRNSRISVQAVDQGVVVLGGVAASSRDETAALQTVTRRPGVRRVVSNIRLSPALPPAPEPEIGNASSSASVAPGTAIVDVTATPLAGSGTSREDDEIRRQVQKAILDLGNEENQRVSVSVRDGVVWLSGAVPTWDGNDARLRAARSIAGVRTIMNEVYVAPPVR